MVAFNVLNFRHFLNLIERADPYPFYAVLLYTPLNGLDEKLHEYVVEHWDYINHLTGDSCLLVALEDPSERGIHDFMPEEVYQIARHLGVDVGDLPALVIFAEPRSHSEARKLRLAKFFEDPSRASDKDITQFLRDIQSIIDSCVQKQTESRLQCLDDGLKTGWPQDSRWFHIRHRTGEWLATSVPLGATVLQALVSLRTLLGY